jgi:hypothetical protein
MPSQLVEFPAPSGRAIDAKLGARGADTLVSSVTASERTNKPGVYAATFNVSAGLYDLIAYDTVAGQATGYGVVELPALDGTYYPTAVTELGGTVEEPTAVPDWGDTVKDLIGWLFAMVRNPKVQTADELRVRNVADDATIGSQAVSSTSTTLTVDGME